MAFQASPIPWDFTDALELLHAFTQELKFQGPAGDVPVDSLSPGSSRSSSPSRSPQRRPSLGNFDRVFRKLNRPLATQLAELAEESLDEFSSLSTADTTPPTTPLSSDEQHFERFISVKEAKEVKWTDQVEHAAGENSQTSERSFQRPTALQGPKSHSLTRLTILDVPGRDSIVRKTKDNAQQQHHQGPGIEPASETNTLRSDADKKAASWLLAQSQFEILRDGVGTAVSNAPRPVQPSPINLTPAWVTPVKVQRKLFKSPVCVESGTITPMLTLTRQEKNSRLIRRLGAQLGVRQIRHFDLPSSLSQYGGNTANDGIHVFVDSSNIAIGFYDALKLTRGLPTRSFTKRAPFSFHSLALIMERGRGVAKRVLVGSSDRAGVPDYMREAARCGYEINALDRVEKFKEIRSPGKKSRGGNGYGTSGQSSGSETTTSGTTKVTEQGVDEILHMKMLESIVDTEKPSTIVLATGDAAEAEYSAGFLKNVERALSKGWKVELVAWGHSMSYAYRSRDFHEKWKGQFMIVDLEDFSEELLGVYLEPNYHSDVRRT